MEMLFTPIDSLRVVYMYQMIKIILGFIIYALTLRINFKIS